MHKLPSTLLIAAFGLCFLCIVAEPSGLFVWQGFNYHWERKELDFETPHRLGSFSSYISEENFQNGQGQAWANFTFTPGVNGDYSYPSIYYSAFTGGDFIPSSLVVARSDVPFQFFDNATIQNSGNIPIASTENSQKVSFTLNNINITSQSSVAVILHGLSLQMECFPEYQPVGGECNSNGIWPVVLSTSVGNCQINPGKNTEVICVVDLDITRSCTPFHFKFAKPFNYAMNYTASVGVTILYSNNQTASTLFAQNLSPVTLKSSGIYPVSTSTAQISASGKGGCAFPTATVGLSGFSLELEEVLDLKADGRYLEGIAFNLNDVAYDCQSGSYTFNATAGIDTTYTNMPIKTLSTINPVLLQVSDQSLLYTPTSQVNGTICFNDEAFPHTFYCGLHGLKAKTTTAVQIVTP